MFKIKTTNPKSYLVRPNQGIIEPHSNAAVKILFNGELDSKDEEAAIAGDKFLVQLARMPEGANPVAETTAILDMWKNIGKD